MFPFTTSPGCAVPTPARILFLVNDDRFFWSHRRPLAEAVRDTGAITAVATTPGPACGQIQAAGFEFIPVRFRRGSLNPARELVTCFDVLRAYRRFRPHLTYHITVKPIVYGSLAARLTGVEAAVNAITGLGYVFTSGGAKRALLRRAAEAGYRSALGWRRGWTIFQNPDDRALFVSTRLVPPARSSVILGSGVDLRRFTVSPGPPGPVRILVACRMLWDKGLGDLVEAARLLRTQGHRFELVLAGEVDPENPASIPRETLAAWNDEGIVSWLGRNDDIAAELKRSHIACLPSYREGIPLYLLEAAASGRPIVTTDVPGCREVVQDGVNGYLVPPQSPDRLAKALAALITDREQCERMGAAGRLLAEERFSTQRVIEQTLAVIRSVLGRDPGA